MRILQINNLHFRRGGADVVYLNTGKLLESYGNEVFYFSTITIYNEKTKFDDCTPENIKFTIKKKVSPKQGRVVLFNGIHYHTAEQPNHNLRCVVNYNLRDLSKVVPGVRI